MDLRDAQKHSPPHSFLLYQFLSLNPAPKRIMTEKHRRYQSSFSVSPETARLFSVLIFSVVRWHPEAFFVVMGLERAVFSRADRIKMASREKETANYHGWELLQANKVVLYSRC